MLLRKFTASDFAWYAEWFKDESIDTALGPIDDGWLESVLAEENGVMYVAMHNTTPVGAIGICVTGEYTFHITEICVHPRLQGRGMGAQILQGIYAKYGNGTYTAIVHEKNTHAARFFLQNGWVKGQKEGTYISYTLQSHSH